MKYYTVTITRQFGSMGRPIAMKMAEMLGIDYYDRDIVEQTAKATGMPVSTISNEEEVSGTSGFFNMIYPLGNDKIERQNLIFTEQSKIIRKLADSKSCILVGRCADYILQNDKNSLHIFIYAPYEKRLRNCVDYLRMDADEAKKMIEKVDKARDKYHKTYAGYLPGDYRHKDILIDSSILGIEGTARLLTDLVRGRFCLEK